MMSRRASVDEQLLYATAEVVKRYRDQMQRAYVAFIHTQAPRSRPHTISAPAALPHPCAGRALRRASCVLSPVLRPSLVLPLRPRAATRACC